MSVFISLSSSTYIHVHACTHMQFLVCGFEITFSFFLLLFCIFLHCFSSLYWAYLALLKISSVQFSSVAPSCPTLQPHGLQHARPPCVSPAPRACSNSCALSPWCHSTISLSVIPFSSHLHSFPASGSFLISQFFTSGGQGIGASASVLPMNIQDWFPLGLTSLISLQFKRLSRVFSNTTVQKHQFFSTQLS